MNNQTVDVVESEKKPAETLITWSGGCDSTMLLLHCLRAGDKVRTLAINHDQVASVPYEKKARRKLKKTLLSHGYKFDHSEMSITKQNATSGGLAQAGIWLWAAIGSLNHGENLAMAYIKADDIWHYYGWYHQAFTSLVAIAEKSSSSLLLPLEWYTKKTIVTELRKQCLFEDTWYCETPRKNGYRCGKCVSCERMKGI